MKDQQAQQDQEDHRVRVEQPQPEQHHPVLDEFSPTARERELMLNL